MKDKLEAFLFDRGDLTRREMLVVGALAIIVAMIFNAPMLPRMTDSMPEIGFGDPYLTAWMVAWDGHALTEQPTDIWDSNTFWPYEDTLAFSEALLGYAPAGLIGEGVHAAVIRHNLLYLFAQAFAFFGAYLLARELGVSPLAAMVAAAAFAYAPWRLDQRTHLHVLSSGGVPLSLFLFARGYRRRRPVVIGWAAVAAIWQISLGFTLGIPLGYALGVLGIVGLVVHRKLGTEPLGRGMIAATVCAAVLMGAWVAWQASPYFRVVEAHPEAVREIDQVRFYSPPAIGLVTSPTANFAWGQVTKPLRDGLEWPTEQALFPGLATVALAGLGLTSNRERWVRVLFGLGTLGCLYLSLGLAAPGGGFYKLLYEVVPGMEGIRVPGRLMTLASLGLGCLAALGAQLLIDRNSAQSKSGGSRALIIALVPLIVLLEGAGTVDVKKVPFPPASMDLVEGPRAHVPSDSLADRIYMFWSIDGFYPVVNGESGFLPSSVERLRPAMLAFPDETSVALLRELAVETVIFHPELVEFAIASLPGDASAQIEQLRNEQFERMATIDITGLGLTRDVRDDAVIFELDGNGSAP